MEIADIKTVTVVDRWKDGHFERYYLKRSGEKVILEQAENVEPPFVKLQLVNMESPEDGTAGNAAD